MTAATTTVGTTSQRLTEASPAPPVTAGTVLDGRYRLDAVIGHGATSTVWQGQDLRLNRGVAIKVARAGTDIAMWLERQRRQVPVMASAPAHAHLVRLFDAHLPDPSDNPPSDSGYVVLELLPGKGLRTDATPAHREVATLGADIARGLSALHRHGSAHGALDLDAVLLTAAGRAKLTGAMIATGDPEAMAQDVHALGTVLTSLIGSPARSWRALLASMTAPVAADRPRAQDVALALTRLAGGARSGERSRPVRTGPSRTAGLARHRSPRQRGTLTTWLGLVTVCLFAAAGIVALSGAGEDRRATTVAQAGAEAVSGIEAPQIEAPSGPPAARPQDDRPRPGVTAPVGTADDQPVTVPSGPAAAPAVIGVPGQQQVNAAAAVLDEIRTRLLGGDLVAQNGDDVSERLRQALQVTTTRADWPNQPTR